MKVSYVSDLHMESGINGLTLPGGDILLLAGDLIQVSSLERGYDAQWNKFFTEEVSKYNKAFYILGNHEHYCGDITLTYNRLKNYLTKYPNVQVMENDVAELNDNWMLFGSTLWTDYKSNDIKARNIAGECMNDHRVISIDKKRTFTTGDAFELNVKARSCLNLTLESNPSKKWIVMTHHTPSMKSCHPKWGGDNYLNYAFHNTEMDEFILNHPNIKFYVHGHTHDSMNYKIGKCTVLCNPKGYGGENRVNFDPNKQFEII